MPPQGQRFRTTTQAGGYSGCPAPHESSLPWCRPVRQPPHLVGEVPHPTSLGDRHMAPTPQWLAEHEPGPLRPHSHRYGLSPMSSGGLIKTDRRSLGVVGLLIQVQELQTLRSPLGTTPPVARASARFFEHLAHRSADGAKPNSTRLRGAASSARVLQAGYCMPPRSHGLLASH